MQVQSFRIHKYVWPDRENTASCKHSLSQQFSSKWHIELFKKQLINFISKELKEK